MNTWAHQSEDALAELACRKISGRAQPRVLIGGLGMGFTLARVLAPGAILRVATDIPDYVRQALEEVPKAGFEWLAEAPSDWRDPWDDWISTRYEQKALREGRRPHYLTFRKR